MGMTRDQAIAILAKDQKYTRQWKLGEGYLDGKDVNGNYYDVSKQPQSGSSAKNGEVQKENTASNTQQQTEQKVAPGTRKYGNGPISPEDANAMCDYIFSIYPREIIRKDLTQAQIDEKFAEMRKIVYDEMTQQGGLGKSRSLFENFACSSQNSKESEWATKCSKYLDSHFDAMVDVNKIMDKINKNKSKGLF